MPSPNDWTDRQDALGPAAARQSVGRLEPGEIRFLERLQAINPSSPLSQQVKWLPKGARINGQTMPSNDFIWLDHGGIEMELKSPGTTFPYAVINRIWKSVNHAWNRHGFIKTNFIIDLADMVLTVDLREALATYNLTQSGLPIERVFVMWQGKIEEIQLMRT